MSELGFMLICMTLAPLFQRRRAGQKSSTQPSRFLHPPRLDCNCMLYRQVLIIPTGVCGETDEAGDVDSEYDGSGVSGVVGG